MKRTSLYGSNSPPLVLVPLCIGGVIYKANHAITATVKSSLYGLPVADSVLQSLPNGLLLFSLLNVYRLFCHKHSFYQNLFWIAAITVLAFTTEYLQAFHIIGGKFDIMDFFCYEFASIVTTALAFNTHSKHLFDNYNKQAF
jgi:hypothetical protein